MGLLDQVLGGALRSQTGQPQGGSSPLMMALQALLSSKAAPHGRGAGGLGGLLDGVAGGATAGQGSITGGGLGGLGGLIESFQRSGHGDVLDSWMGSGGNQDISPSQLGEAIGHGSVGELSRRTGMPRDDLLSELSKVLPGIVDQMTPHGRAPSDDDVATW